MRSRRLNRAIVCGTDFSPAALAAADASASLARVLRVPLLLVHSIERVGRRAGAAELRRAATRAGREGLKGEQARLAAAGVRAVIEVHEGRPDEVLATRAAECSATLVVVGCLGHPGGARRALGSVSERTAESSAVPTLVVRSGNPFAAWVTRRRPVRIFAAFDGSSASEAALGWLRPLMAAARCELSVGFGNWPAAERARFGAEPAGSPWDNSPEVQHALERDVRGRAALLSGVDPETVEVRPVGNSAHATLIDMARDSRANLIVVGNHQARGVGRAWHRSVSRAILNEAPVSVLCVPSRTAGARLAPVPPLRRILVSTDFSSEANRALPYAAAIGGGHALVRLVTVVHPRSIGGGQLESALRVGPGHAAVMRRQRARLEALAKELAASSRAMTDCAVVESVDVARAICQEAERFGADAIVLASALLSAIERAAVGSVAERVMAHTRRPVLVVRPPSD